MSHRLKPFTHTLGPAQRQVQTSDRRNVTLSSDGTLWRVITARVEAVCD